MSESPSTVNVTKLEVSRRQLHIAIELWFTGGDPTSIHTLAFASFEMIHALCRKSDRTLGLPVDDAPGGFDPQVNEPLMVCCLIGLEALGEMPQPHELAFARWAAIHRADLVAGKLTAWAIATAAGDVERQKALSKDKFLEEFARSAEGTVW